MESVTERVDKIFAPWDKPDSPGCALAVMRDGHIVYERGYGCAHLEHGIPIVPDTVFHVASVSKQFTVFAILLLVQEGKLSLDDDVRKHVPEVPDFGHTIQVQHLIHHTSGLRDQWELLHLAGWRPDDLKTNADVLYLVSRQTALSFNPGDEHVYCNTGYTLLGIIVERLTGKTLRQFTTERIFEPLGMANTHFHDDHSMIVKNRASAYEPGKGGLAISIPAFDTVGATALFTTVRDMARWDRNWADMKVGGPAVIEAMQARVTLNSGELLDYAGGVMVGTYRGLRTVQHSGGDAGYRAHYLRFPDQKFAVTVLCNLATMAPSGLCNQVAEAYLGDVMLPAPQEPVTGYKADEKDLAAVAGLYYSQRTEQTIRLDLKDGTLILPMGPGIPLIPMAPNRFRIPGMPIVIEYAPAAGGKPATLTMPAGTGKPTVLEAVAPMSLGPVEMVEYAGAYHSTELGVTYAVTVREGKLVASHYKQGEMPMAPTLRDHFSMPGGDIVFARDGAGKLCGFRIYTGRSRRIWFARD